MNENNGSEFGAFLAGFVIGGLVGAAAALVLAPQSGSETRSQIMNRGQDLSEAGTERVHQVRDTANQYLHRFDTAAEDGSFDAEEQARIVLDSGKQKIESEDTSDASES